MNIHIKCLYVEIYSGFCIHAKAIYSLILSIQTFWVHILCCTKHQFHFGISGKRRSYFESFTIHWCLYSIFPFSFAFCISIRFIRTAFHFNLMFLCCCVSSYQISLFYKIQFRDDNANCMKQCCCWCCLPQNTTIVSSKHFTKMLEQASTLMSLSLLIFILPLLPFD